MVTPVNDELYDYIHGRVRNNHPEAHLFTNKHGYPYTENWLTRMLAKVREQAGLPKSTRAYDFTRHSFASNLVYGNQEEGITLRKVHKKSPECNPGLFR